jgi:hypothetical protein
MACAGTGDRGHSTDRPRRGPRHRRTHQVERHELSYNGVFRPTHLRAKDGVAIILHFGAKVLEIGGVTIDDPGQLLDWLAMDRAMVAFADVDEVWNRQSALEHIVRQWIRHV